MPGDKFSLILATLGRTAELERFLDSLESQTHRNFELIVVDQNPVGVLQPILLRYEEEFPLVYVRSGPGLSAARNEGLKRLTGDIVGFPDDDCWYAPDTLGKVALLFAQNPDWHGVTGRPFDDLNPHSYDWFSRMSGRIDKNNVWRRSISFTIFLRSNLVRVLAGFDEELGAGSRSGKGSAEETDYLIRAISCGFRLYYRSELSIFHRATSAPHDAKSRKRGFSYSVGMGYVLKKHGYPRTFIWHSCLRALAKAVACLLLFRIAESRYQIAILRGRILGWRA